MKEVNCDCLNKENLDLKNYLEKYSSFDFTYISNGISDTKFLGKSFAKYLNISDVININGELGSGKTIFMSGFADFFNISNQVSSPTFNIVNEYSSNIPIYHFDVYRINSPDEFLEDIGTDYFETGISVIEWGNIIKEILPNGTINIEISKDDKNENIRYFHIWRD